MWRQVYNHIDQQLAEKQKKNDEVLENATLQTEAAVLELSTRLTLPNNVDYRLCVDVESMAFQKEKAIYEPKVSRYNINTYCFGFASPRLQAIVLFQLVLIPLLWLWITFCC